MPEDSEEECEGRASLAIKSNRRKSFVWICFIYTSFIFFGEMLFWLKEEMAPQELTRRLATVITHVGK